jgi:hypothetical protein
MAHYLPHRRLGGHELGVHADLVNLAVIAAFGSMTGLALWPREAEVEAEVCELEVFANASVGNTPARPRDRERRRNPRGVPVHLRSTRMT